MEVNPLVVFEGGSGGVGTATSLHDDVVAALDPAPEAGPTPQLWRWSLMSKKWIILPQAGHVTSREPPLWEPPAPMPLGRSLRFFMVLGCLSGS